MPAARIAFIAMLALSACGTKPLPDVACPGLVIARDATDQELLRRAAVTEAGRDALARAAVADALTGVVGAKLRGGRPVEDAAELTAMVRSAGPQRIELDVLAMTTGGQYGAYGSGFLTGWSRTAGSPKRPEFDVVTGASAGGLIAPLAFLGPEADDLLKLNVGISDPDVIRARPFFGLLGGGSIYTTDPLRARVSEALNSDLLERIAEEGRDRRLFLGASNITTGRFDVFGIDQFLNSESAAPNKRSCVIEALMATSAIPALFAPRSIDGQTYLDAGIRQHVFVEGIASKIGEVTARSSVTIDVNLYVIVNGDLIRPAGEVQPRLIDIAERSFSLVTDEGLRQSLLRTIRVAERNGWTLRAVRAPRVEQTGGGIFSREVTTELYRRGIEDGASARIPWMTAAQLRRAIED